MFATLFTQLDTETNEIEAAAGRQAAGVGESGQQFDIKDVTREDLIELLTVPADAARAAEPTNPGIQERFRFNRNLNDADLLAAANSFTACDAAEEALLITFMAPATWKADLAAGAAGFDAAFSTAASAHGEKVAATAEVKEKTNKAMQTKRTIHNMVKIVFKGNAPALAAWHSASTVEKLPTKEKPPTPPVEPEEPIPPTP